MMNIIIAVYLVASVNVMLVNSKAFPIIQFEYVTLNIKEVENLLPEDTANFWFFSSAVLK